MNTMESMAPFEPPHFDAVTSLAITKDHLISGSRDKNLRLWSLDHSIQNLKSTSYAHQDWINDIETNTAQNLLYSGSKDGTIKVWTVNRKLRCISDINAHSQSVNSICKLYDEYETMFASGSSDKSIRLWKPKQDDLFISKNEDADDNSEPNSL